MKERLNADVKQRESFRPFVPAVMAEHAGEWSAVEDNQRESPFMLRTWPLRDGRAELVPAVVHVDGSARGQTVREAVEPRLHGLLQRFQDLTGVPMVLNTSLNGSCQPIVETPVDAIWSILEPGLDFLVIEGQLVEPADRPRSLLYLVPVMAATSYTLEMALSGDDMNLAPDSRSTFTFWVSTPGACASTRSQSMLWAFSVRRRRVHRPRHPRPTFRSRKAHG